MNKSIIKTKAIISVLICMMIFTVYGCSAKTSKDNTSSNNSTSQNDKTAETKADNTTDTATDTKKDNATDTKVNNTTDNKVNAPTTPKVNTTTGTSDAEDLIKVPDKIVYYNKGKQTVIDKKNKKFDKIVKLVKARITSANDIYKTAISSRDIEKQEKSNNVVEFIYTNKITMNWKYGKDNKSDLKLVYNTIVFPLDGQYSKMAIFTPTSAGPIGPLKDPKELLNYIKS
ncbi:hypothetical protein JHL18_19585 [Clostridium sp. YIM B02505]|uniref:Lipoprotein n=1 Tax=Clostridium yunnanense TaxID=2800325 RepID=A0ABS1ETV9_9CLOT|nr:hypothetical protein [Clostridium yunnanense]MBK1812827.1 hypothetical protein [Clostridium yunnanense]